MPINAGAIGIPPVTPQRPAGETEGIQRRDDGSTAGGFRPQTTVTLKTAIEDLAGTLAKISSQEKFGINKLPSDIGQVVRNILQQAFSVDATISQGIGSTIESQRFSNDQLMILARMLSQIGALAERGFSMELSDETKTLLAQFKNLIVSESGGSVLEPVLMSKSAFELIDSKNPEQLPQVLYELLAQLAQPANLTANQPQQSEGMNFLNQLVKYFMPRPSAEESTSQTQQQQTQQQQTQQRPTPTPTQRLLNSMYRQLDDPYANLPKQQAAQNHPAQQNLQPDNPQPQNQQQAQNANQQQPAQSQPQNLNQQQPAQSQSQNLNQQQPAQSQTQNLNQQQPAQSQTQNLNQQQPAQSQTQNLNQQQPAQSQPQNLNQQQPAQSQSQNLNQQQPAQSQPQNLNQQQPAQSQPQNLNQQQNAQSQTQNLNQQQNAQSQTQNLNQQQPAQSQPQNLNQQQPAQSQSQNLNQQQPAQSQPQNLNQPSFLREEMPVPNENFLSKQQELKNQMQAAKNVLLKQPMQNTPQTMDTMKSLAHFLMRNSQNLSPRESILLQNFVNNSQKMFPETEARHLQNLLRLCQQNVPTVVQQAAVQHKLPDLPRLWAFMQLCDMANISSQMTPRAFKKAGREVSDFANIIRGFMGSDNSTVQNQRSFQMMVPIFLGANETSYPTYLSVYDEDVEDPDTGVKKKETWLRICVLTDNIGAAELIFRVYEGDQLDMRFYFSQSEVAEDFRSYVADLRNFVRGTHFNIGEIRIGSIGERMLAS